MTGVIRKATLLVALGLVAASAATAGIPSAANCTVPTFIKVVGTNGGTPDPRGTFSITVRDIGNFPCANSNVVLNFSACTDMRLCSGAAVVCAAPSRVTGITNGSGVVTFTVVGGGLHPGGSFAGLATPCVTILADSYVIGTAVANVYDLNGALAGAGKNGVSIGDLPLWLADWAGGAGPYKGRSDFNQNGSIGITDLPPWLQLWGPLGSASGCTTTYCP
jgi:hypothetical protein